MAELAGTATGHHDYSRIDVKPISGALGAEIQGVDIASGVDDETFGEIHRAWLENHAVDFRDQNLTPAQHIAFARRLGDVHPHLLNKGLEG